MNKDTKIIKIISFIVGLISFLAIILLVEAFEVDFVTDIDFIKYSFICTLLMYLSIRTIDLAERIEDGRK